MKRLRDLPIRRKLTLSIMLTCTAGLLLACGAFVAYDVASFRRELVDRIASLAGVAGHNTTAALEFDDPKSANETLSSLRSEPALIAAFVYDRVGTVFAVYHRAGGPVPTAPAPRPTPAHEFTGDELRLYRPIEIQGETVGRIVLIADLTQLSARISRYLLIVTLVFAVSLVLVALLSGYFERLLIRPILNLAALTRTVAEGKDHSRRAIKESDDEIGGLIDGFNNMLSQLQGRDAELHQAHALLEKRVEERTAALKQTRDEAAREHARFKLIFDSVPVGICLRVVRSGVLVVRLLNDAHLRICGLTPEQAAREGIFERISHPEDYARQIPLSRQLAAGMIKQFSLEKRYLTPDGRTVWVVYSLQRRSDGAGNYEELSTVVDITERKQSEMERERISTALHASETKFSRAFHTHPDAICISRLRDNVVLEVNPAFAKLTGYAAREAVGRVMTSADLAVWVDPADRIRLVQSLQQTGETTEFEAHLRRRDGTAMTCAVSAGLMEIDGEACVLAITRDLTAHRRLEAQLSHAGKMEAIGQLAGGVAHDYNNILTATLLQLGLLLDQAETPALRTALQDLSKMANRAADLTRQLLAFSRQQVIQVRTVELNEVVVDLLRMLSRLLGENIRVGFTGTAELLWIDADVGMIEQVVTNLCVNARDAMAPQGGELTITTASVQLPPNISARNPEAYPGHFVCLSVQDTGCGMDAPTIRRIFEPFFTTKEIGKGTGLGLATVYGIAKQHRGWVEVQSEVGRGSTFRVYLPVASHDPLPASESAVPVVQAGHETILIVEDEQMVRRTLNIALERAGYRVIEAADGVEALARWAEHRDEIALLLSDMVMPNALTGLDLAKRFKQDRPDLKIIITSGYSVDLRKSGIPTGPGLAYLAKPFEVDKLIVLVRECLDSG